jgi:hypothetical protein
MLRSPVDLSAPGTHQIQPKATFMDFPTLCAQMRTASETTGRALDIERCVTENRSATRVERANALRFSSNEITERIGLKDGEEALYPCDRPFRLVRADD